VAGPRQRHGMPSTPGGEVEDQAPVREGAALLENPRTGRIERGVSSTTVAGFPLLALGHA